MHAIGNETDARTILEWLRNHSVYEQWDYSETAPEGWKYLGHGSFRSVWASPEGVAYKVSHSKFDRQSAVELENLRKGWLKKTPKGCRIPRFSPYRIDGELIIAVEKIKGQTLYDKYGYPEYQNHHREEYRSLEHTYRLDDMHEQNVMVDDDGLLVLIDLGC